MSSELSGPYRHEDGESQLQKRDLRIRELEGELKDTQQSLANERLENRLLRGTTRVKRGGLLIYGLLRYGFTRGLAATAGAVFSAVLLFSLVSQPPEPGYVSRPPPRIRHHRHHAPRPPAAEQGYYHPTMVAASALFVRWYPLRCYSSLMCHESCASVPDWTWGGELVLTNH